MRCIECFVLLYDWLQFCQRWTQWPMTPVEGCPTVFQTICSLPPGYHQVCGACEFFYIFFKRCFWLFAILTWNWYDFVRNDHIMVDDNWLAANLVFRRDAEFSIVILRAFGMLCNERLVRYVTRIWCVLHHKLLDDVIMQDYSNL